MREITIAHLFLQVWLCCGHATSRQRDGATAFVKSRTCASSRQRKSNEQHVFFSNLFSQQPVVEEDPRNLIGVNQISRLKSLVDERSEARWEGNYTHADLVREQIENVALPSSYKVVVTDVPRKLGGGSTWKLVKVQEAKPIAMEGPTVLQLAHTALGLALESSVQANLGRAHTAIGKESYIQTQNKSEQKLASIVLQAKARFLHANWTDSELAGRKSADAAFWFALSGVTDPEIFQTLVNIATRELSRFGERSSCRSKDIYQILERFAAAGVEHSPDLEYVAKNCISHKGDESFQEDIESLVNFHSNRSLLLIWKFSTKQKKQRSFLQSALKHWQRQKEGEETTMENKPRKNPENVLEETKKVYSWETMFTDPSRPLVVDIGCGMGVSLLGLAKGDYQASSQVLLNSHGSSMAWKDFNFVGVDLGGLGIGYARGLASRWGIGDRLQFVVDSADNFLENLQRSYPGRVHLCLIQFPTPYQLNTAGESKEDDNKGNSQLPASAYDGFMVTKKLLQSVHQSLSKTSGRLLLQSNCEDVAVHMRNTACNEAGFSIEVVDIELLKSQEIQAFASLDSKPRIPQRTADWAAMGGERANGPGWCEVPILHREGATETEVACGLNGTPVHRCLLRPVGILPGNQKGSTYSEVFGSSLEEASSENKEAKEKKMKNTIKLVSLDVDKIRIHEILKEQVTGGDIEFLNNANVQDDGCYAGEDFISSTHVSMAFGQRSTQPAIRDSYGALLGSKVEIVANGFFWDDRVAALAVDIAETSLDGKTIPKSDNEFPHVTVWVNVSAGARAHMANALPSLVEAGNAKHVGFPAPVALYGTISFWDPENKVTPRE